MKVGTCTKTFHPSPPFSHPFSTAAHRSCPGVQTIALRKVNARERERKRERGWETPRFPLNRASGAAVFPLATRKYSARIIILRKSSTVPSIHYRGESFLLSSLLPPRDTMGPIFKRELYLRFLRGIGKEMGFPFALGDDRSSD